MVARNRERGGANFSTTWSDRSLVPAGRSKIAQHFSWSTRGRQVPGGRQTPCFRVSFVPPGLTSVAASHPALKCWAIFLPSSGRTPHHRCLQETEMRPTPHAIPCDTRHPHRGRTPLHRARPHPGPTILKSAAPMAPGPTLKSAWDNLAQPLPWRNRPEVVKKSQTRLKPCPQPPRWQRCLTFSEKVTNLFGQGALPFRTG